MAQYEEQNPLDYRAGGDTVDDAVQKYMKEIPRIYQFLNNIREHNSTGPNQVEPQPYIFKVTDNKLYIRNGANNAWLYLFDITYRMGMSDNPDAVILTSDDVSDAGAAEKIVKTDSEGVAHISISGSATQLNGEDASHFLSEDDLATVPSGDTVTTDANKLVKINANGLLPVNIAGNAAKIAGIVNEINNLQDGQVLTYRIASNSWRNEDKGVVGAGKALAIYDGDTLLDEYSGDAPKSIDLGTTATNSRITREVSDLNDRIDLVDSIAGRETAVSLGDTAMLEGISAGFFLECTTEGTTAATAPTITPPVSMGDTITDGTAEWTVRKVASIYDGIYNKKETFTSSGTFTAPYTGIYRITIVGGGGGGAGSGAPSDQGGTDYGGGGGGSGCFFTFYSRLEEGTAYNFTIGAGGTRGSAGAIGGNGGDSSITIGANTYTAGGGTQGGPYGQGMRGGTGGVLKINGDVVTDRPYISVGGTSGQGKSGTIAVGGVGGLSTVLVRIGDNNTPSDSFGRGGVGGSKTSTYNFAGGGGGDGYITFEYCDL